MRAGFILNETFTGLKRNITMTVAMILTTAISLGLFGAGLLTVIMSSKTEEIFLDKIELRVNLVDSESATDPNCEKQLCTNLRHELDDLDGVESVTYLSPDDVYTNAKKVFKDDPQFLSILEPGMLPSAFIIKIPDMKKMDAAIGKIKMNPAVNEVIDQRDLVSQIFTFLHSVRNVAFLIAALQAVVAVLLMANTVQISAFTRKTEIGIMRLVGATRWYTQLPFLLETVISALIGSIIAGIGLLFSKHFFFDKALDRIYSANLVARISTTDVLIVIPYLLITSIVVAVITAYVALRSYVRD